MPNELTEEPEFVRPTADRVARRALALAAVVCRSGIEPEADNPEVEEFRSGLLEWLSAVGVADELEPEERAILEAPAGTLSPQESINASWRGEGLVVLAWALGRYELPSYDLIADSPDAARTLGFLDASAVDVLSNATLRDSEEIDQLAELMFAAHCDCGSSPSSERR
jgi:hypothetical protein